MKLLITVLFIFSLSSCAIIDKYMTSDFDNVEFSRLVELEILTSTPRFKDDWCNQAELYKILNKTRFLSTYSKYTLNSNILEIYSGIHDLANELYQRSNPSIAYCKIKRKNINKVTNNVLKVFGERSKR